MDKFICCIKRMITQITKCSAINYIYQNPAIAIIR